MTDRAALEAIAAGTAPRPRGNAVLPGEYSAAAPIAHACRDLVDATLHADHTVYEDEDPAEAAARGHVPAPSEALPPLP